MGPCIYAIPQRKINSSKVCVLPRTPAARVLLSFGEEMPHESRQVQPRLLPTCLAELRRWAHGWVSQHAPVHTDPETVVLAMTEMVTNAIRHAAGPVEVELTTDSHALVVGVTDRSETFPRRQAAHQDAEGGRGLVLVERLANRWGVRARPEGGKTVWCEFA